MAGWEKVRAVIDGEVCEASAPVIISASRATDIPAFHGEWLLRRLDAGGVLWRNPFNGVVSPVSFAKARLFVFWTKDARPMLPLLDRLDARGLRYYFQFTVNDYESEGLEPGVPPLEERLATFAALAARLGRERVVWRFDPLILSDTVTVETLAARLERVGERLRGHTSRLVISFADIEGYRGVRRRLAQAGGGWRGFTEPEMRQMAERVAALSRRWGLEVETCCEACDLSAFGIGHGRCVDDRLIARAFGDDAALRAFVARGWRKDRGQRKGCGCIPSKDIGAYATCPHRCAYCYANRA
jgi:hypothetical protein